MNFSKLSAMVLLITLTGCSGHLYTVVNPSLEGTDKKVDGILTYQPVNVIELYKFVLLVDEKSGNVKGSLENGECLEDRKIKFSIRADYSRPQLIGYAPGLLDKNKFGLTLKDGVVASVNSESDPTSALKDLASVLPFIKAPFGEIIPSFLPSSKKPLCNGGEKFIGLYLAPDILPFDKLPK